MKMKLPIVVSSIALIAAGCASDDYRYQGASAGTAYESTSTQGAAGRTMQQESSTVKSTDTADASATAAATTTTAASADADFIKEAAKLGLAEVQLGQLAQQKGQSQAVKDFGQKLVSDHQKANQELMSIAAQKGIQVPTQLGLEETQTITQLSTASGADFDRQAAMENVKAHQKAIQQFQAAQNKVQDPQLKAFIEKTLPTLQGHLQHAEQLQGSVSAMGGSGNVEIQDAPNPESTSPTEPAPGSTPMSEDPASAQ